MNYDKLAATYTKLVNRYDQRNPKMRITMIRNGSIDTNTGDYVQGSEKKYDINGVITEWKDNQIDGQVIKRGDRKIIADNTIEPRLGDHILIDGLLYTIVEPIVHHNPGGTILGYEFNARR